MKATKALAVILLFAGFVLLSFPSIAQNLQLGAMIPSTITPYPAGEYAWGNLTINPSNPLALMGCNVIGVVGQTPYAAPCGLNFSIDGMSVGSCGFTSGPNHTCGAYSSCSVPYDSFGSWSGRQTMRVTDCRGEFVEDVSIWIDNSICILQENEMVVAETFAAGRTLQKSDLRFPVRSFCSTLPILVTQAGNIVEQRLEEYGFLEEGYITIPENQTWTFFYIADVSPDVAVICEDGVYSAEQNECVVSPAIVFSCSGDAIFDPVQRVCVTQPETRMVCEFQDAVYDTQLQKCVRIIPTEQTDVVCPSNSVAELENGVIKRCVFTTEAAEQWVCLAGQLDTSVNPPVCNRSAETELTTVDLVSQRIFGRSGSIILLGIGLIVSGGFLFVKGKR